MEMLLKVQVMSAAVDHRSGVKEGREWEINEQEMWVQLPNAPFPEKARVRLPSQNAAFPVGHYQLDVSEMLTVDRYGSLALDSRKLQLKAVKA